MNLKLSSQEEFNLKYTLKTQLTNRGKSGLKWFVYGSLKSQLLLIYNLINYYQVYTEIGIAFQSLGYADDVVYFEELKLTESLQLNKFELSLAIESQQSQIRNISVQEHKGKGMPLKYLKVALDQRGSTRFQVKASKRKFMACELYVFKVKGMYVENILQPNIRYITEAFHIAGFKTYQAILKIYCKEKFQEDNWYPEVHSQQSDLKNYDCEELQWCPQEYNGTVLFIGKFVVSTKKL